MSWNLRKKARTFSYCEPEEPDLDEYILREVARLDRQVSTMRTELESLRELQKETQLQRIKHKKRVRREDPAKKQSVAAMEAAADVVDGAEQSYASDSEYFTDYQSVLGTDGELDSEGEFYDVHTDGSSSDDTLKEPLNNGQLHSIFDQDTEKDEK